MKYLFFILFFVTSPLYAQRRVEEVIKKEEVVIDKRIDLSKIKNKGGEETCGTREFAYSLVGDLYFPPFSWTISTPRKDTRNVIDVNLQGIGVDYFTYILNKVFKDVHYSTNIIVKNNEEINKAMLRGSADIYVDAYYDNNPSSGLDFIFPSYLTNHMVVVQKIDSPDISITSLEDLKKYKGVVREEDNAEWIYKTIGIDLKQTDKVIEIKSSENSAKEALSLLLSGEVDYFFSNTYSARAEISRYKVYDEVEIKSKSPLVVNRLFFAISKVSLCRRFKEEISTTLNSELFDQESLRNIVLSNIKKYINFYKDEPKLTVPKKDI